MSTIVNLNSGKYIVRVTEGENIDSPIQVQWIEYFDSVLGSNSKLKLTGEEFGGWDPANEDYGLEMVDDHIWETVIEITSSLETTPYKLTINGSYDINWSGGANGMETFLPRDGDNVSVSLKSGTYFLRITEGDKVNSPLYIQWIEWSTPLSLKIYLPALEISMRFSSCAPLLWQFHTLCFIQAMVRHLHLNHPILGI